MNDKKLKKIKSLKNIFTIGFIIVLVLTIIDIIIPDPIILIDEALLASLTGLFTIILSTLDDKEKELINNNKVSIKQEDVTKVATAVNDVVKNVKKMKK